MGRLGFEPRTSASQKQLFVSTTLRVANQIAGGGFAHTEGFPRGDMNPTTLSTCISRNIVTGQKNIDFFSLLAAALDSYPCFCKRDNAKFWTAIVDTRTGIEPATSSI